MMTCCFRNISFCKGLLCKFCPRDHEDIFFRRWFDRRSCSYKASYLSIPSLISAYIFEAKLFRFALFSFFVFFLILWRLSYCETQIVILKKIMMDFLEHIPDFFMSLFLRYTSIIAYERKKHSRHFIVICILIHILFTIYVLSLQLHSAGENLVRAASCGESVVLDILNGLMAIPSLTFCLRFESKRSLLHLIFLCVVWIHASFEIFTYVSVFIMIGKGSLWSWGWSCV